MITLAVAAIIVAVFYYIIGWKRIFDTYGMWFERKYWTNYNIVEMAAWMSKAIIIVPGLIFGIQIWQLYFLTLLTSILLIWASMRKSLPTLVAFNTLWVVMSVVVIGENL